MDTKGELIGAFHDIPIEVYHHPDCPAISSTQLKTVLKKSVAHWKYAKQEDTDSLSFGRLFHDFISDPQLLAKYDPSKKSYKDILLASVMFKNMMDHPIARSLVEGAKHEVTFFSRDKETGLLKKCRVDGINGNIVFDFKSTKDASMESFISDCKRYNYRIQAAYYLEIVSEVMGQSFTDFRFIASEKEEPNMTAVYRTHDRSLAAAHYEIREGLNKIKLAIDSGSDGWNGYSKSLTDILI